MRKAFRCAGVGMLFLAASVCAQDPQSGALTIVTKQLPAASMWTAYSEDHNRGVRLSVKGGIEPYHWRLGAGLLPDGLKLDQSGELSGTPQESGLFEFTVLVADSGQPPVQAQHKFVIKVETPFSAEWDRKALVSGNRIDGSVKVSNRTGRDFDLTFIVLAVNDIGRATAIGYQHFPLKSYTRDMSLPLGDTLPPGNYIVNVDAVAEEPISNRILRARLVTNVLTITQGP